ncbi:hypothetical protein MCOR08_011482 [Pyricularia oryzae]|nr:hypothetical protein MCOR16_011217 [Pyricularia oryzae]KAI6609132.1 hypothetical protein MCOR08_011482 [Pyricularia oryzae]
MSFLPNTQPYSQTQKEIDFILACLRNTLLLFFQWKKARPVRGIQEHLLRALGFVASAITHASATTQSPVQRRVVPKESIIWAAEEGSGSFFSPFLTDTRHTWLIEKRG